jgi:hypothetical protein
MVNQLRDLSLGTSHAVGEVYFFRGSQITNLRLRMA